jgi:hypothetical protein
MIWQRLDDGIESMKLSDMATNAYDRQFWGELCFTFMEEHSHVTNLISQEVPRKFPKLSASRAILF